MNPMMNIVFESSMKRVTTNKRKVGMFISSLQMTYLHKYSNNEDLLTETHDDCLIEVKQKLICVFVRRLESNLSKNQ